MPTPWWAVVSAASAPTVLLACATIARSMRIESYDPFTQTLSALAVDGRGEWIMTAGFAISASCLIITAVGLRVLPALPRIALAIAGCCGLATAALPDRLGTATAHIAATGIGIILLAIWPVLTVSLDPAMPWPRRARWAIGVSGLLFGLVVWLCCDAWSGINVGLSERTAATAEMLWPLVVVVSARRHLPAAIALPADISAYPRSEKGVSQYISRPRIGALCRAASFVRGVTGMTSNEWQPVVRVGEPRFIAGSGNRIKVELKTKGWLSRDWRRYFGSQVSYQQLDARYCSFLCWDEVQQIEGSCAHDDAEHYVEMIDAAIHYANSKFASDVLPRPVTPASHSARGLAQVRHRQAALDHLAKKLARPD